MTTKKHRSTRRRFLTGLAAGALALPVASMLSTAPRSSARRKMNRRLVLVNLEGGCDALAMVPPHTGSSPLRLAYESLRPTLAGFQPEINLPGSSDFALHPSLSLVAIELQQGNLAIVQKTGLPTPELSHFKAQQTMSRGRADLNTLDVTGWLGRLADLYYPGTLDILGIGLPNRLDFSATNESPVALAALESFEAFNLTTTPERTLRESILAQMAEQEFAGEGPIMRAGRAATRRGLIGSDALQMQTTGITVGPNYPDTNQEPLSGALQDVMKMIRGGVPTKVFYARGTTFDTHGGEELASAGNQSTLSARLTSTFSALSAFIADLKTTPQHWADTTIIVFTEFGRRNYENGTEGTDHGHGYHTFVFGGSVQAGMKGQPVTLSDINQENLPVDIDYREVLVKALDWLDTSIDPLQIFDDYTPLPQQPAFNLF